jgi:hypothetical protein
MTTTSDDVLWMLAENDGNYIVIDLTGRPRVVMKDRKGREICTVPQSQFDNLRFYHSFIECVGGKWRLNDAGKVAARLANGDRLLMGLRPWERAGP